MLDAPAVAAARAAAGVVAVGGTVVKLKPYMWWGTPSNCHAVSMFIPVVLAILQQAAITLHISMGWYSAAGDCSARSIFVSKIVTDRCSRSNRFWLIIQRGAEF